MGEEKLKSFVKKPFTLLHTFQRAFPGWECDEEGWIVEIKGERKLVLSSHGGLYFADDKNELEGDLERYKSLIDGAEKAITYLKGK